MSDLMSEYQKLNNLKNIPNDYSERYEALAAEFLSQGRLSMSETCRRRAQQYRPRIISFMTVSCDGGYAVPYVTMAAVASGEITRQTADEVLSAMEAGSE